MPDPKLAKLESALTSLVTCEYARPFNAAESGPGGTVPSKAAADSFFGNAEFITEYAR